MSRRAERSFVFQQLKTLKIQGLPAIINDVRDMLFNVVYRKQRPFQAVLMDTGYASKEMMLFIESFLVWVRLKELAVQTGRTVYQLTYGLLDDYLTQRLKNPSPKMVLA